MGSNEEIIRNLYAVAEKEPKRFRSLYRTVPFIYLPLLNLRLHRAV